MILGIEENVNNSTVVGVLCLHLADMNGAISFPRHIYNAFMLIGCFILKERSSNFDTPRLYLLPKTTKLMTNGFKLNCSSKAINGIGIQYKLGGS